MMFTAMVALWLPPASAAPPRVLHDALVRAGPEAVVHRFESGSSARYFSVVRVGGAKNWPTRETFVFCLLYTSPSPRDVEESRMPSSA